MSEALNLWNDFKSLTEYQMEMVMLAIISSGFILFKLMGKLF